MTEFWTKSFMVDGLYAGLQTGYEVILLDYPVKFKTERGLRGINIPVRVTIINGKAEVKVIEKENKWNNQL